MPNEFPTSRITTPSPASTKPELLTANTSNLPGKILGPFLPSHHLPPQQHETRDYHLNWLRPKAISQNNHRIRELTHGRKSGRYLRDWSGGGGGRSEEKRRPPAIPGVRGAGGVGGGSGIARRSRRWRIGGGLRLALGL